MSRLHLLSSLGVVLALPFLAAAQADSPADKSKPLRERDRVAVQVIFTYGDSHTKSLPNGGTIQFDSDRSGSFEATLDRYYAYYGVDSFKLEKPGKGNISVGDSMIFRVGGGSVVRREKGSGQPVEDCVMTAHIDSKRKTYSLAFTIQTQTTVTLTGPGSPPQETPSEAGLSYETGDLPLPADGDVIRGHAVFHPHIGSGKLGTNIVPEGRIMKQQEGLGLNPVHARWQIGRPGPKPELELILSVENHAKWIPEGPTPDSPAGKPGNTAVVTAKLRRKDGGKLDRGALNIRFIVQQSSTERGACLNFPVGAKADAKEFDLRYVEGGDAKPIGADGQAAETAMGDWQQATATLGSFDWGAYGSITATAYVPHYGDVLATVEGTGKSSLQMPKRSEGSNIANAWKERHGVTDLEDTDDTEKTTGNKNDGDGLSLYEEYRGLIARGKHSRRDADAFLDPKRKDLVVLLAKQGRTATYGEGSSAEVYNLQPVGQYLSSAIAGGRLLASAILNAQVVNAFQDEAPESRQLNANSAYGLIKPQHGVLLYAMNGGVGDIGVTAPLKRHDKTPIKTDFVAIDFAGIAAGYAGQSANNKAAGIPTPYTLAQEVANTVAHELAHSCGAAHHGDRENEGPTRKLYSNNAPPDYRIYGTDNVEITEREQIIKNPDGSETKKDHYEIVGQIAGDESRSSGDLTCIMCYPNNYAWRLFSTRGKGYVWRAMLPLPMGTTLCTGRDGNPANTHFGPATASRGNCRAKIKIKDY
jgi:hypothetical protein